MMKGRLFLVPTLFFVMAGCTASNTPSEVSGKVSYQGKVVTAGTVRFHSSGTGENAPAGVYPLQIHPDGTYIGTDLPAGTYAVTIETESANKNKKMPTYGGGRGGAGGSSPKPEAPSGEGPAGDYVKIPAKYDDVKKSGLTANLVKGKNTVDFELKD